MSFKVTLFTFAKRDNSTKRPAGGRTFNCVIKADSGILSPSLDLDLGVSQAPTVYNYAYIPDFKRYYFIKEWTFTGRLWIASLECDILASWKDNIGAATLYVTRAASKYNIDLMDTIYPAKIAWSSQSTTTLKNWTSSFEGGTYVIGMIGGSSQSTGSVTYYEMTPAQFRAFTSLLYTNDIFESTDITDDISLALWRCLFNPFQYVVSCIWLPFEDTGGVPTATIAFGWWDMPCECRVITKQIKGWNYYLDVPKHANYETRGRWLAMPPFTEYMLTFQPWGDIVLDPSWIIDQDQIIVRTEVDMTTGKGLIKIQSRQGSVQYICSPAQVGVIIPIANQSNDVMGAGNALVTGAGAGTALGGAVGAVLGVTAGVTSALNSLIPQVSSKGAQGSAVGLDDNIVLRGRFWVPAEEDIKHFGRPLMESTKISTLSGYLEVADGDIEFPGTVEELRAVKSALESGIYYE